MPDTLRVVNFDRSGRPHEVLDLNSSPGATTAYFRDRDAGFSFVPGAGTVQYSTQTRRYAGGLPVSQSHENGTIGWTAYVRGATLEAAVMNVEALLVEINSAAYRRYVEWAPEGGESSFFEIRGPGSWAPNYNPVEFVQTNAMRVALTFPSAPLAEWIPCSINDTWDLVDSLNDYDVDAGTASNLFLTSALLKSGGSTNEYFRLVNRSRGYKWFGGLVELTFGLLSGAWPATATFGVVMRDDGTSFLETYLASGGAHGVLKLDAVVNGTRTNLVTSSLLASPTADNYMFRVYFKNDENSLFIELYKGVTYEARDGGNVLFAGLSVDLSSLDLPINPPTIEGFAGFSFTPGNANTYIQSFRFEPFSFPGTLSTKMYTMIDEIPGDAPALADVQVGIYSDTDPTRFMLIAWDAFARAIHANSCGPLGVYDSTQNALTTENLTAGHWSSDASGVGGQIGTTMLLNADVGGADQFEHSWRLDTASVDPDDFTQQEITVEVWGHLGLNPGLVNTYVVLSVAGLYSNEWGDLGFPVVIPDTAAVLRWSRLGTVSIPCDVLERDQSTNTSIDITINTGAGSGGPIGIDAIAVVRTRQRALGPSGKPYKDGSYPSFAPNNDGVQRLIKADLSGAFGLAFTGSKYSRSHGLGGAQIEPNPGPSTWMVLPSSVVPDAPDAGDDATTDSVNYQTSIHVRPRSFMFRTS